MRKTSLLRRAKHSLLGKPLDSSQIENTKLNWVWGLPILASDAVSSVAYAIEEILLVLVPVLGLMAVGYVPYVSVPIILLLMVLAFSYAQIIKHYPSGGGAYNVASDNFGKRTAVFSASALVIDYVLTVAVSISSATAAVTSAFPILAPYRIPIALTAVLFITLMNLRGSQESSKIFGIPTYTFITLMGALIITGLIRLATGHLQPLLYETIPAIGPGAAGGTNPIIGIAFAFLLMRAFASGCSALTGIEAVSNSMPSFKKPRQKNAQIVLYLLAAIVFFIFGGSIILANSLQVVPFVDPATGFPIEGSMTVVAQMGQAVFGTGSILFYLLQFATALILMLAANTAYTDLPNLLSILARDGFMPRQLTERGAKLTLSNGIIFLLFTAGGLIIIFGASVHHLIPLYSVGVFLSFTISQIGMIRKWIREKRNHWQTRMIINVVGAVMTATGLVIVFTMKFSHGAWILALALPALSYFMYRVHRHYASVRLSLRMTSGEFKKYYHPSTSNDDLACYVLVNTINRATLKNINYANQISRRVKLVHVAIDKQKAKVLQRQCKKFEMDLPLIILDSPYRDITTPLVNYFDEEETKLCSGCSMAVVMTRFIFDHAYDNILHNQTSYFISRALRDYKELVTILVPYHTNLQKIRASYIAQQIEEEYVHH